MSDERLALKILTASGVLEEGRYDKITVDGSEGEFGVFPGHIPFITALKPGILTAFTQSDDEFDRTDFAVLGGFCEVQDDNVLVLAVSAEKREDVDAERAKRAEERARERLENRSREGIDFARAEAALERALARLRIHSDIEA